jgi:MFS family permease
VGSIFAGIMSDKFGRKKVIILADIAFTLGSAIQAFAPTILVLMIGRVIIGLGIGIAAMIVPVYIAEISPTELRGKMVAIN